MPVWRVEKFHIIRLSFNVESKQSHLIERAAARLAETRVSPPQAKFLVDIPARMARDMPEGHTSELSDSGRSQAAADRGPSQIDAASLARAGLIHQSNNRVAEELRIIQNRVLRQSFGANGAASGSANLVMITSALKAEGKSFISINLAGEIARQGDRRVLLVDIDAKPDSLSRKLGRSSARGLVDLACDIGLEVDDVIIPTEAEGLDVLPFGRSDKRRGEILASRRMGEVVEEIGHRHPDRLIIFDAPPCLSSSTPHALASVCGQVVVVVAASSTQEADVEAALDLLKVCPQVSLLLNKVPLWMAHSFGSYSYPGPEA
jgi:protein-tyrosine kinase